MNIQIIAFAHQKVKQAKAKTIVLASAGPSGVIKRNRGMNKPKPRRKVIQEDVDDGKPEGDAQGQRGDTTMSESG